MFRCLINCYSNQEAQPVEAKGKDALKVLADVLNKNFDIDILIEGHTDNIPIKTAIYKDNWDLSVARATSIVRNFDRRIQDCSHTGYSIGQRGVLSKNV
jgi:flagellar motor protein MotB